MNDKISILGIIPTNTPGYQPYPGSLVMPCDHCGIACWVGPKQAVLAEAVTMKLCMPCVVKLSQQPGTTVTIGSLGNKEKG